MMTMLFLLVFHHTAMPEETSAQLRFETREDAWADRGISHIRVPVAHVQKPITLKIHPTIGCLLEFSAPYTYLWASDQGKGGQGGHFSYQEFGVDDWGKPTYQKLLIKPVLETEDVFSLWFQIGEQALQVWVMQTPDLSMADHRVYLDLLMPAPPIRQPEVRRPPEEQALSTEIASRLLEPKLRRMKRRTFTATYDRDRKPFLAFRVRGEEGARPVVESVEIVRGRKVGRKRARFQPKLSDSWLRPSVNDLDQGQPA